MQRSFKISLSQEYYSEKVCLSQYDSDYAVNFEVLDKGAKAPINGMSAYFEGTRCDGLSFRYSGTASDNVISFTIDTALTAVAGRHTGEIVLYDGSGLWFGSANVQILVEKAARPDNAIDADVTNQQTLLEQITTLAEQTEESADGIINMSVSAQTLAQGAEATVTKTVTEGVVNLHFGLPLASGSGGGSITANDITQALGYTPASTDVATTSANGLMSAQDKSRLDDVYADYSSALTALGVI